MTYDLDSIPQELSWTGWATTEPLDEGAVIPMEEVASMVVPENRGSPPALDDGQAPDSR